MSENCTDWFVKAKLERSDKLHRKPNASKLHQRVKIRIITRLSNYALRWRSIEVDGKEKCFVNDAQGAVWIKRRAQGLLPDSINCFSSPLARFHIFPRGASVSDVYKEIAQQTCTRFRFYTYSAGSTQGTRSRYSCSLCFCGPYPRWRLCGIWTIDARLRHQFLINNLFILSRGIW